MLLGNQGDDYLEVGKGSDSLYGGTGDDILIGGAGKDYLYGDQSETGVNYYGETSGTGYDIFVFSKTNASDYIADTDIIVDFDANSTDLIAGTDFGFGETQAESYGDNSILLKVGGKNLVILEGVNVSDFDESDFTPFDLDADLPEQFVPADPFGL